MKKPVEGREGKEKSFGNKSISKKIKKRGKARKRRGPRGGQPKEKRGGGETQEKGAVRASGKLESNLKGRISSQTVKDRRKEGKKNQRNSKKDIE